jgi:hypothetical protein
MFKKHLNFLLGLFCIALYSDGVGRFDPIGGTYDEQTTYATNKALYYAMRTRSLIADLSRTSGGVNEMESFPGLQLNPVIRRKKIDKGDMIRDTMVEAVRGLVSYGDMPVRAGGFLEFKNQESRVNQIDSPAYQVVGKMSQQRVKETLPDLPEITQQQAIEFMREELEFQAIAAILQGASPAILETAANGGSGISLGVGAGAGAGVPLMGKNWYTTDTGFITYDTTPATHNSTVNDAVNGIDAADADKFTLAQHNLIRARFDNIPWEPVTIGGKRYKAIGAMDPDMMWRLRSLLATYNQYAMPRGKDNPLFNNNYQIEMDDIIYFSWPNLKKYRPAYNATTLRPDFGPVTAGVDPRGYSTSSSYGLVIYLGGNALLEGFNDELWTTTKTYDHGKGWEVSAHMMEGFVRSEWYAKDGRTDTTACENRSSLIAAFYEPGIGS